MLDEGVKTFLANVEVVLLALDGSIGLTRGGHIAGHQLEDLFLHERVWDVPF